MLLMYQYGAQSVRCAVCHFVTSVGVSIYMTFFFFSPFSIHIIVSFRVQYSDKPRFLNRKYETARFRFQYYAILLKLGELPASSTLH